MYPSLGFSSLLFQLAVFLAASGTAWCGEETAAQAGQDPLSKATLRLFLVRHAEAFRNLPKDKAAQEAEIPLDKLDTLTPHGLQQAGAAGQQLKDKSLAAVLTAPTGRARQTAARIAAAVGLQEAAEEDANFRECGREESAEAKAARALLAVEKLALRYNGKTVAIVTHQHLILALVERAARSNPAQAQKKFSCPPGSVAEVAIEKGRWTLAQEPAAPTTPALE